MHHVFRFFAAVILLAAALLSGYVNGFSWWGSRLCLLLGMVAVVGLALVGEALQKGRRHE